MRQIANLFLALFSASALFGLGAFLVGYGDPSLTPTPVYRLSQLACLACAALLYAGFAFNLHLPKSVLLAPGLWLLWSMLNLWPLDLLLPRAVPGMAAAGQLLIAGGVLLHNRLVNGQSLWLVPDQFSGPAFSGRRFACFMLLNIPLLPVILVFLFFALLSGTISNATSGFVDLKPNGLYMSENRYAREGKSIQLVAMIHLARTAYYQDIQSAIPSEGTLILVEGVSDRSRLLDQRFSYRRVAGLLGLTPQEELRFPGRLIDPESLEETAQGIRPGVDILPADIDLQHFDPRTVELLNELAVRVFNEGSANSDWSTDFHWLQERMSPELNRIVMHDLLEKRNHHLLGLLPDSLRHYDHLVIPWGALHLPDIESALLQMGFERTSRRQRLSIDFLQLPYTRIWKSFANPQGKV